MGGCGGGGAIIYNTGIQEQASGGLKGDITQTHLCQQTSSCVAEELPSEGLQVSYWQPAAPWHQCKHPFSGGNGRRHTLHNSVFRNALEIGTCSQQTLQHV